MNTTKYLVADMSCAHCKARIEKEVNALNGIDSAEVELDSKILTVNFDDNKVSNDTIVNAVSEVGYTAEIQ